MWVESPHLLTWLAFLLIKQGIKKATGLGIGKWKASKWKWVIWGSILSWKYLRDIRCWYRQKSGAKKKGWNFDFEHLQYKMSFALLLVWCYFLSIHPSMHPSWEPIFSTDLAHLSSCNCVHPSSQIYFNYKKSFLIKKHFLVFMDDYLNLCYKYSVFKCSFMKHSVYSVSQFF